MVYSQLPRRLSVFLSQRDNLIKTDTLRIIVYMQQFGEPIDLKMKKQTT